LGLSFICSVMNGVSYLMYVASKERITAEAEALNVIAFVHKTGNNARNYGRFPNETR
ncbi:hypothetical protein EZS27_044518, partial [termite gut metagenome]